MKKALVISSIMLGIVFLAGCSQQPVNKTKPISSVTQTSTKANSTQLSEKNFVNNILGLQFSLPGNYSASSNYYGVEDPAMAEAFFFRRESEDYNGVPILDINTNLKLSAGQTFTQLAQSVYSMNKGKNYAIGDLKTTTYDDHNVYEFGLQSGYIDFDGYQKIESSGGKVIFVYQNGKVLRFLQTGIDAGLASILSSLKFK